MFIPYILDFRRAIFARQPLKTLDCLIGFNYKDLATNMLKLAQELKFTGWT